MNNNEKFGINITKWCRRHEKEITEKAQGAQTAGELSLIIDDHRLKLSRLMHERLVHLIVLFITVVILLFSITLIVFAPDTIIASAPLCVIVFVLVCFYVKHYFFLENTVQRWYAIDEELAGKIKDLKT